MDIIAISIEKSSGVAKGGRSAPGGTFMGAALWAMLQGLGYKTAETVLN